MSPINPKSVLRRRRSRNNVTRVARPAHRDALQIAERYFAPTVLLPTITAAWLVIGNLPAFAAEMDSAEATAQVSTTFRDAYAGAADAETFPVAAADGSDLNLEYVAPEATAGPETAVEDLVSVFRTAQLSDPTYLQAQANLNAVMENVVQARGNMYRPVIGIAGAGSKNRQDIEAAFGNSGRSKFKSRSLSINMTQPVFYFDRYLRIDQSDQQVVQAEVQVSSALQNLMLQVAQRYFDILGARDNLRFAEAEKRSLKEQLEQTEQRFEVGLTAITDVQEARAGYDRAAADVIVAANEVENAIEALRESTGVYYDNLEILNEKIPLEVPEPADVDQWSSLAQRQNLDVTAAQIGAEIAEQEIGIQQAGRLPTLDLVGSYGHRRSGGQFGDNTVNAGSIGMELNIPLYSAGQVSSRSRQARHRHNEALAQLDGARRAALRQARQAYLGVVADISSIRALEQAVVSSKTALESIQAGFEVGTRTAVDVVIAERTLLQSRRDLARARYTYILDVLQLKQAAGTLSPEDLALANEWLEAKSTQDANS